MEETREKIELFRNYYFVRRNITLMLKEISDLHSRKGVFPGLRSRCV